MKVAYYIVAIVFAIGSSPVLAQGKKDKGGKAYWRAQTLASVDPAAQGKAERLLVNPWGEVDGLLLEPGTIVTFPAHMGDELAAVVKPGDQVAVKGYPESASQIKGYVVTNTTSNQTVMTLPKPRGGIRMPKFFRRMGLKELSAQGEVAHVRFGGKGEVNGVILSDGTIIRFKREALYRFGLLLQVGQRIAATGYGSETEFGRALEATALGAQGQPLQPLYAQ